MAIQLKTEGTRGSLQAFSFLLQPVRWLRPASQILGWRTPFREAPPKGVPQDLIPVNRLASESRPCFPEPSIHGIDETVRHQVPSARIRWNTGLRRASGMHSCSRYPFWQTASKPIHHHVVIPPHMHMCIRAPLPHYVNARPFKLIHDRVGGFLFPVK